MASGKNGGKNEVSEAPKAEAPKVAPVEDGERIENDFNRYQNAIYVDAAQRKWPAKIVPLPLNKALLVREPDLEGAKAELTKILSLPVGERKEALLAYESKAKEKVYLRFNGSAEVMELIDVGGGKFAKVTEFRGRKVACMDLLINFSEKKSKDGSPKGEWSFKARVPHEDAVPKAPQGQRQHTFYRPV